MLYKILMSHLVRQIDAVDETNDTAHLHVSSGLFAVSFLPTVHGRIAKSGIPNATDHICDVISRFLDTGIYSY